MEIDDAVPFLRSHHRAVVITLSEGAEGWPGGVPHATNVVYAFDGSAFRVSVTDSRVKTRNARRTPKAVVHVDSEDFWSYVSAECDVELSPTSTEPGDDVGQELLRLYERIQGEPHEAPDEFLQAMVDDGRLVMRLTPTRVYGQLRRGG